MGERAHTGQGQNHRTPPNCARCRNHDIILPLKGHKHYCKYIECTCEKCQLTAERQKVMARQTAIRRREEQDRQRLMDGLPVPGQERHTPPPSEPENSCSSATDAVAAPVTAAAPVTNAAPVTPPRTRTHSNSSQSGKELWDSILLCMNLCGLPVNTTPLLHIILNEVTPDVHEVYSRFRQAQEELKKSCFIKDEARRGVSSNALEQHLHNWSLYCPPALPQPPALYRQHTSHYHSPPSGLVSFPQFRYHPYSLGYSMSLHELHNARSTVVVPNTECYYREELKPSSPSSEYSDKSSFSGSV